MMSKRDGGDEIKALRKTVGGGGRVATCRNIQKQEINNSWKTAIITIRRH